jgi:4-carboxymuconolactone decarboxylase
MTMTSPASPATLSALDDATRRLVRVAAIVAAGTEADVRDALADAQSNVPLIWIEELLLQTYLFAGFPRALNAFREWRRRVPAPAEPSAPALDVAEWERLGRATCRDF